MRKLLKMLRDCEGATAIEYGLIAALIATAIVVGFGAISNNLGAIFELLVTTLENAMA